MGDHSSGPKPTEADFRRARDIAQSQRHVRKAPALDHASALDMLYPQLVECADLYQSSDLPSQRLAVVNALLAVEAHLKVQGFSPATLAPLLRPVAALIERDGGAIDYMFCQRAAGRSGRPKSTMVDHDRKGILSVFAEAWLRAKKSQEGNEARKLAECSRQLKGRWFGSVSKAELKTALDLVRQEEKDHPAVQRAKHFFALYAMTEQASGSEIAFSVMVRCLNDLELPFGAGEGGIEKTPPISPSD